MLRSGRPSLVASTAALAAFGWAAAGCVGVRDAASKNVLSPRVWMQAGHRITLHSDADTPRAGRPVRFAIEVEALDGAEARPVAGVRLDCMLYMPDSPGHFHAIGPHSHREEIDGLYPMRLVVLPMGGTWVMAARVRLPGGAVLKPRFKFDAAGPPWPPEWLPENGGKDEVR